MSVESLWIHPAVLEEAEAVTDWYAHRSGRAAERFLDDLIPQWIRSPLIRASILHTILGTRRMVPRRFPFVVIFREAAVCVEIIAIAHGRRRPGYWQDRPG